jgi:hypothetical protein
MDHDRLSVALELVDHFAEFMRLSHLADRLIRSGHTCSAKHIANNFGDLCR